MTRSTETAGSRAATQRTSPEFKDGEDLTVDTLFPFAQVALRQAALDLEGRVEVEVVAIHVDRPVGGVRIGRISGRM